VLRKPLICLDIALKAVVVLLLGFAVTHTEWARFASKAMTARAVLYPLLVAVPASAWAVARVRARRQGRAGPAYPLVADVLVTVPFVVDLAGNALNLYDSVNHFDDACHLINWAILTAAVGTVLVHRRDLPTWVLLGLLIGFGDVTAVLWEIGEYGAFVTKAPEVTTAYSDTIGDLALGTAGTVIAAALTVGLARRRTSRTGATFASVGSSEWRTHLGNAIRRPTRM
jgi:hypothetical protein